MQHINRDFGALAVQYLFGRRRVYVEEEARGQQQKADSDADLHSEEAAAELQLL